MRKRKISDAGTNSNSKFNRPDSVVAARTNRAYRNVSQLFKDRRYLWVELTGDADDRVFPIILIEEAIEWSLDKLRADGGVKS